MNQYMPDPSAKDDGHLKLLSIFYYVNAGLMTLALVFTVLHYVMMRFMFTNKAMLDNVESAEDSAALEQMGSMFNVMAWFYVVIGLWILTQMIVNFLAARYIKQKTNKVFTMIVAGINCLNMPLGTALGIFTFILLSRATIAAAYQRKLLG